MLRVVRRFQAEEDSIVAPGDAKETEQKVRTIAGDSFGLWALRDLLSKDTTTRHLLGMQEDDVVTRVAGGVKEGKYVFVRKGGVQTALPPPLPPPVSAPPPKKEEPKKVTAKKPWKLDVTVFTNSKAPWPKGTVTVSVRGPQGGEQTTKMTSNRATPLSFTGNHDSPHEYEIRASAPGWDPVAPVKVTIKNEDAKTAEVELAPPKVHLRLHYQAPDDAVRPFPKDFALKVEWDGAAPKDVKVEDEKGYVAFDVEKGKTNFTLKFDHTKTRYLVHAKAPDGGAGKATVEEDPNDDALRAHTTDGKLLFALPRTWSLVHAKWDAAGVTVPQDGKIAPPDEGIGTKDAPANLTLVPKVQYVRFEFHDRKYWKDHSKKRVPIPGVVLMGARKSDAAGAPTGAIAGSHDAVSNWVVEKDDAAKACQALPWVVTRKDDGTELAKLDKEMLLEWGWEKGFVHSKSKTERVVVKLEPADDKRKPSKDRSQYYDLPKLWKSKCWWTRTSDATKCGFFDELAPETIELSLTKATPMTFSLDDIVLVDGSDAQTLKDWDKARPSADLELSKYSRVAVLHLDPEDAFKVKVHAARAKAPYFSDVLFGKAAADKFRNVLPDYAHNARAVVFCDGYHDVWDKRTEAADFAKLEILGARAAKLDDADASANWRLNHASDVTKGYVHSRRVVVIHYLHYGATDGTTVYSAAVTHWSAFIFSEAARKPAAYVDPDNDPFTENPVDARNFREIALGKAMDRWNGKDYQFEEADDKTDLVVKSFCMFEAKEVEDPAGTFNAGGGPAQCQMAVGTRGSWATDDALYMRKAAYQEEPARFASVTDYDGTTYQVLVMAHELGHAAIGLWDDYITQKWQDIVPCYSNRYQQHYPGVPYFRDERSMMMDNHAPRLRMFWGRANWLNDEGATGNSLHKFLAGRKWKITWAPAGKTKFGYVLDEASRNIYVPTHKQPTYSLGEQGKATMYLYKLGDDEMARMIKGGPYDGILVVEMRLAAGFRTGVDPALDAWEENHDYAVSDCVEFSSEFYACVAAHRSADGNKPASDKWFQLDPELSSDDRTVGVEIKTGRWRTDAGVKYVGLKDHEAGALIPEFFVSTPTRPAVAWAPNTNYAVGQIVTDAAGRWLCTGAHRSTANPDEGSWEPLGADQGAFADGTDFDVGDTCTSGGNTWICTRAHKSGSAEADVAAGRLLQVPCWPSVWTDVQKKDWVQNTNLAITNMLEGADGKLKLTTDSGAFSKTYLRVFPQWSVKADPADADPANTQFSLTVVKGGGAKCFGATAAAMKVGSETNAKTVVRYLYGKLSDVPATRKTQDSTSDLAKADLSKLSDWMGTKVTGKTFAVDDIT